ncbi:MAG: hypothetical protein IT281_04990 [Ignavibacteria bacterium]|nr:hypothetical protein [Ignavibacteria bacterium]MCC7158874.1 hypothetical protein [Ignavibacteria bacterium]
MTKFKLVLGLFAMILMLGFTSGLKAQNGPAMYFCESYGSGGEVNISDRFYTGKITVMVKCDYALGLKDCAIQLDKYNGYGFDYYKKVDFDVTADMKYIYFESSDLRVDSPGIYRCFLLDNRKNTVASALVEFIR